TDVLVQSRPDDATQHVWFDHGFANSPTRSGGGQQRRASPSREFIVPERLVRGGFPRLVSRHACCKRSAPMLQKQLPEPLSNRNLKSKNFRLRRLRAAIGAGRPWHDSCSQVCPGLCGCSHGLPVSGCREGVRRRVAGPKWFSRPPLWRGKSVGAFTRTT